MQNQEIIKRLEKLKTEATELGYVYLQTKLPVKLGNELTNLLKPFVKEEKAIDKAIKSIK